jgi:hypothetical protein
MVNLESDKMDFEINLFDDEPVNSEDLLDAKFEASKKTVFETHKTNAVIQTSRGSKKSAKKQVAKPGPEANVDNWFYRQFNKLFDDNDTSLSEQVDENTNN